MPKKQDWKYSTIRRSLQDQESQGESDDSLVPNTSATSLVERTFTTRKLLWLLLLLSSVNLVAQLATYSTRTRHGEILQQRPEASCSTPSNRQEWRSASPSARIHYLDAVLCLMQKPSLLHPGTSRYDDFVYGHITTGQFSHYAAAFLPWHRYFLRVFEQTLQSECQYKGSLFYWDWTLDARNLSGAPVWDPQLGFGGDGNPGMPTGIYRGNCVTEGVFANTTRAYLSTNPTWRQGVSYSPHCLARAFFQGPQLEDLQRNVSAQAIESLLEETSFEQFFESFERGSHQVIPQFVHGDFMTYTAPNDPVFFLHHTQVDRIWWLWQQRDAPSRFHEIQGAKFGPSMGFHDSKSANDNASLDNLLPMGGLGIDRTVREVMDAGNNLLCYTYED